MNFFKSEDFLEPEPFSGQRVLSPCDADWICAIANAKLLKEGVVVYSQNTANDCCAKWHDHSQNMSHKALLICIEKIEECKHEKEKIVQTQMILPSCEKLYICECGARVTPIAYEKVK